METSVPPPVSHDEAKEIARRLIAGAFRRDGERLDTDDRPRFSIPCRPAYDDDCRIIAYIEQQCARDQDENSAVTGTSVREILEAIDFYGERLERAKREEVIADALAASAAEGRRAERIRLAAIVAKYAVGGDLGCPEMMAEIKASGSEEAMTGRGDK